MSDLQDALLSNANVYAGGSGMVPMPEFDPADDFIPDTAEAGLVDGDEVPTPDQVEPQPEEIPEHEEEQPEETPEPEEDQPEETPEPEEEQPDGQQEEPRVRGKQDFLHRLNSKNKKIAERDARIAEREARIAELEAALAGRAPAPKPAAAPAPSQPVSLTTLIPDLVARRKEIIDLTIDGNTEAAAQKQAELEQEIMAATVAATTKTVLASVKEQTVAETVDSVVAEIAATYIELDESGDHYDTKAGRMINAVTAEYIEDDYSPAEALRMATDEVMRLLYPRYFTADAAPKAAPAPKAAAPKAAAPAPKAAAVKTAVTKAVQAAKAQPGLPAGNVNPRAAAAEPLDVFNMSDDEFSRLTKEQISALRGDSL